MMRNRSLPASILMSFLLNGASLFAQEPVLREDFWVSGNSATIHTALIDVTTNTLFTGGSNTLVYQPPSSTSRGAVLDLEEGWPTLTGSPSGGNVWATVPDGSGGWFIGGNFTEVNGVARSGLARLNADGTLNSAWDPGGVLGGSFPSIYAMSVHNGVLYVGGEFTSAGGAARHRLAAYDIGSGSVTSWNQGFSTNDGQVRAIAVTDAAVYVGGDFTHMGGEARSRIAALELSTGAAQTWAPIANGDVLALAITNGLVYAGGEFTQVNGTGRNKLAAIGTTDGVLSTWNPGANSTVHCIAVNGDTVFVGGEFTMTGGANRFKIAALQRTMDTNNALAWDPRVNGSSVRALQVGADVVYVGGQFDNVGLDGLGRRCAVAFDRTTGVAMDWNPGTSNGVVYALAYDGVAVYAGGSFGSIGYRERPGAAAFDLTTGRPTMWEGRVNSGAGGTVKSMALKGDTLFIGGVFSSMNGVPRQNLAAVSISTGIVLPWEVNTDDFVEDMLVDGDRLLLGGSFTSVNGVTRLGLAAVNISTASVVPAWQADGTNEFVDAIFFDLDLANGQLYVAGDFDAINGVARMNRAALDPVSGAVLPWETSITSFGTINHMAVDNDKVYTQLNTSQGLVALDAVSGELRSEWDCDCSSLADVIIEGDLIYTHRGFPDNLIAVERTSAVVRSWSPEMEYMQDLERAGEHLVAVGTFETVDGADRRALAVWVVPDEFEGVGTGVQRTKNGRSVQVFPNPSTGVFTLRSEGFGNDALVTVLDANGRTVRSMHSPLSNGSCSLDLSDADSGAYTVHIMDQKQVLSIPLLLNH